MKRILLIIVITLYSVATFAQYPLVVTPQTIDFTNWNGTGFVTAPVASQLDSDIWEIIGCSNAYTYGGNNTAADYTRGTTAGGVTTGGIYAYSSGGDEALWVQSTGSDMTPGEIRLHVLNNTGAVIPNLAIQYEVLTYNDQGRATAVNFAYDDGGGTVSVPVINYTSPAAADASPTVTRTPRITNLMGINLGIGATIELIWQIGDAGGSGSRDEVGLDNIELGGMVAPTVSVGFAQNSSSLPEGNAGTSTHTVDVTMPVAPSGADVVVDVSLDITGSATVGTDFTYSSPTTLTFPVAGTYPLTQSVTITVNGDVIVEPNESVDLTLAVTSGTANTGQTTHRFFINNDDAPSGAGIIVNEASQGEVAGSGRYEYIELLVIGTPGETVDLRGWIVDDNSGIFTGGSGSQLGIAEGHVKFSNSCTWEKVPVGALIVLYSEDLGSTPPTQTRNAAITNSFPGGDDPTDGNLDFTYVVRIDQLSVGNCASAGPNLYFSSDCANPSNTTYDQYLPAVYSNPDWATITLRNTGDAVQTRAPDASYFHGLSYGTTSGGSCGTCDFVQSNHPDFGAQGINSLVFDTLTFGPFQRVYSFTNTLSNDFRDRRNWSTTATADNVTQTPGASNNAANDAYIQSLRRPFEIVTSNDAYTCDLRENETRVYLGGNDSLILWIQNNIAFDHGPLTAQTIFNPGGPFQNINIVGSPYFIAKQFRADPTNTNGAGSDNYTIRLYATQADLDALAAYVNLQTGSSYTGTTIMPLLRMYKVPGLVDLPSNSNGGGVLEQVPATGTYNGTFTFENTWVGGFSAFGLGIPENVLDGEAILLTGEMTRKGASLLWSGLGEIPARQQLWKVSPDAKTALQLLDGSLNQTFDQNPSYGTNRYQLSATLVDGRQVWSNTVEIFAEATFLTGTPYPQPASDQIHFPTRLAEGALVQVELFDLAGKRTTVASHKVRATGEVIFSINLPQGVYSYRLRSEGEVVVGKMIVGN